MHRRNRAEHAILTFKSHFLSILAGMDSAFPPYLWDLLLPQAELTLNLLWQSMLNPRISAWEYFQGPFDFNKMPLGPVGCWDHSAVVGFLRKAGTLHWIRHGLLPLFQTCQL